MSASHELRETGVSQRQERAASAAREARFEEELRLARLSREHLWIALFGYRVTVPLPAEDVWFDLENLRTGPLIGCYICEEPYSERLGKRACQGEPG